MSKPYAAAVLSLLIAIGCAGSETTAPESEPPQSEPPLVLDFSDIAGTWVGTGVENNGTTFWIEARLSSSAEEGRKVGEIEYGPANSELGDGSETECVGEWLARAASPPSYRLMEVISSPCPNGTITLEHSSTDGTLYYHYVPGNGDSNIEAAAILTRP